MGHFFSLSKSATETWLSGSEGVLLVCGLILAFGAAGEYLEDHDRLPAWMKWSRRPKLIFVWMVALSLFGEFAGDAGVFLFSGHLQTISDREYSSLNKEAGLAREDAGKAIERAAASDLARLQLENSMEWRRLSDQQKHTLCSTLSPKVANVSEIISSAQDPEAFEFADDFASEMRRCAISGGFEPSGHLGNSSWSSDVAFGIWRLDKVFQKPELATSFGQPGADCCSTS